MAPYWGTPPMLLGASGQLQGLHGGEGDRDLCDLKLCALVPWRNGQSLPLFAFSFPPFVFRFSPEILRTTTCGLAEADAAPFVAQRCKPQRPPPTCIPEGEEDEAQEEEEEEEDRRRENKVRQHQQKRPLVSNERPSQPKQKSVYFKPAAAFSAAALSVRSHVNSGSSRPKWP